MLDKQQSGSKNFMNPNNNDELNDELQEEYDFSQMKNGVRGKYAQQYYEDVKLIQLEPDVAKMFPNGASVNEALRALSKIIQQHEKMA